MWKLVVRIRNIESKKTSCHNTSIEKFLYKYFVFVVRLRQESHFYRKVVCE
jgi:hypothetical protein